APRGYAGLDALRPLVTEREEREISSASAQKQPVRRVLAFVPIPVTNLVQRSADQMPLFLRHYQPGNHSAIGCAVVAV
ncbi:Unknown protein sequence, partial [Pseudomonas syringae pv. solidagae]